MTTPKNIESLKENQIFVFGSNLNGNHVGGAAKLAIDKFGAIEGQGEGLQGQSYAFPTLNKEMKKVSQSSLLDSKVKLYECAKNNPDKQFLVTKVGCGIAGFDENVLKKIFKGDKPRNIVLPAGWSIIRGYKAFEKGLKCRNYQYELGKNFYHKDEIELCKRGFHFCLSLGDVYNYYQFGTEIVIGEIETEGDVIDEVSLEKSVTNHLRVIRILNAEEASNNNGIFNTGHSNTGHWNTGHSNTGHWNTGHRNTGDFNTITPQTILVFNKECDRVLWNNTKKPSWLYFDLIKWIGYSDMTDEEKTMFPEANIQGGYLKKYDYKEAFKLSYKKATEEERQAVKKLPNWDKNVFFEISGIMID